MLKFLLQLALVSLLFPIIRVQGEAEQWAQGRAGYVTINDRQYYMDDVTRRDWSQATDYCNAIGMVLTSFETQSENDAIYQYLTDQGVSTHEFWTSGTKVVNSWFWLGTGASITWFNWAAGEPNSDATSVCIHTSPAGWADDDCFFARYYLCEEP